MNTTLDSNSSSNSTGMSLNEIGGIAYLLIYASEVIPYTVINLLAVIVGIFGNLLILATVILHKELHNTTNMFVFNLALADLFISSFVDVFTVVGILTGKKYFDQNMILCHIIAGACLVICETSLMNIGFLAINRYINICHHQLYDKIFSFKKTLVYCLITWCIGISIDLPNIFGWGGHYYDLKTLNCVWNRLASQSYSIFFPLSSIVLPCICIFFCYIRIFIYAASVDSKVSNVKFSANRQEMHKSLRIAKGLFASFMLFTLCWLPYGVVVISDYHDKFPKAVHMFTMLLAHLNSALNPVLYGCYNPAFRRGYKKVCYMFICQKPPEEKMSSITKHTTFKNKTFSTLG